MTRTNLKFKKMLNLKNKVVIPLMIKNNKIVKNNLYKKVLQRFNRILKIILNCQNNKINQIMQRLMLIMKIFKKFNKIIKMLNKHKKSNIIQNSKKQNKKIMNKVKKMKRPKMNKKILMMLIKIQFHNNKRILQNKNKKNLV